MLAVLLLAGSSLARAEMPGPMEIILTPEGGDTPLDRQILATQTLIKSANEKGRGPLIEKLGWIFVAKARLSNDPGFYKLAEQCATWLQSSAPQDRSGLLLKGHILDAMHRFHEAEDIGGVLVKTAPDSWESFALLGDTLMEQGRIDEAVVAYQKMMEIRPCSQAYLRIANIRWLTGDLTGALEAAKMAVEAGSTRDPEPVAWAYSRLALYQYQAQDDKGAEWSLNRALQYVTNYAPALLLQGKMAVSAGKKLEAVALFKTAARENPLPEYQWILADAQRAAGQDGDAKQTEEILSRRGAVNDPRTYSLFLATRAVEHSAAPDAEAQKLAEAELQNRQDLFTQDAAAWASLADGNLSAAQNEIQGALTEGTQDARLFLHAAVIANAGGHIQAAAKYLEQASALKQMLYPSERTLLAQNLAALSKGPTDPITLQTTAKRTP